MRHSPFAVLPLCVILVACPNLCYRSHDSKSSSVEVLELSRLPDAELIRRAPSSFVLDGREFVAIASATIYSFPIILPLPTRSAMSVDMAISNADGPVPDSLVAEVLYVIRGDEVWISRPEYYLDRDLFLESKGGPAWAGGDSVDVVARLRTAGGRTVFIRVGDVPIEGNS